MSKLRMFDRWVASIKSVRSSERPYVGQWEYMKSYTLEPSFVERAHKLSLEPWEDWLPYAEAPFAFCFFEWSLPVYQSVVGAAFDSGAAGGMCGFSVIDNHVDMYTSWKDEGKDVFYCHPYTGRFSPGDVYRPNKTGHSWIAEPFWTAMAWGPQLIANRQERAGKRPFAWQEGSFRRMALDLVDENDVPPISVLIRDDYANEKSVPGLVEIAGTIRFCAAALSLMYAMPRAVEMREVGPQKTLHKGNIVRTAPSTILVVRPDAPRYWAPTVPFREPSGAKKRQHDVKAHLRTLRSGRVVKVRSHERGDPTLGRVDKRRLVEMDPNRNYNFDQSPGATLQKNPPPQQGGDEERKNSGSEASAQDGPNGVDPT